MQRCLLRSNSTLYVYSRARSIGVSFSCFLGHVGITLGQLVGHVGVTFSYSPNSFQLQGSWRCCIGLVRQSPASVIHACQLLCTGAVLGDTCSRLAYTKPVVTSSNTVIYNEFEAFWDKAEVLEEKEFIQLYKYIFKVNRSSFLVNTELTKLKRRSSLK